MSNSSLYTNCKAKWTKQVNKINNKNNQDDEIFSSDLIT
jgi:hypothetical protein